METEEEIFGWQTKYSMQDVQYLDYKSKGPQTLTLLVISNVCSKLVQLYRLKNFMREHPQHTIDYSICLGNLAALSPADKKAPEAQARAEGEISAILDYLENLGCKTLYVPGAQDPDSLFEPSEEARPKLTVNSHNIHKSSFRLAEGLVACGLGGHLDPASTLFDCSNYSSAGYFANSLRSVVQNAGVQYEKSQFILCSYVSPSMSTMKPAEIPGTSSEFMSVLGDTRTVAPVVAVLHGNRAFGKSLITSEEPRCNVVNPGPLCEGCMAVVDLIRTKGVWRVSGTEFVSLI